MRDSRCVATAIATIKRAVADHNVRTIHDIPCGDFNWQPMLLEEMPEIAYQGFDIVPHVIKENRRKHPNYRFSVLDIVHQVPPRADLIFCKDLLNHLSDACVKKAVENMKLSGSTYLLASNNRGAVNTPLPDHGPGSTRHLDITAAPFHFKQPLWMENGYCWFWRLSEIGDCAF
jgi:hypothetical protein